MYQTQVYTLVTCTSTRHIIFRVKSRCGTFRDQVFFVPGIAFEFELKVLTDLEFHANVLLINIVFYHLVVLVKLGEINKKCSLLNWIQSDQKRRTFFVAWIAFEFELKVLAVLEFQYEVMELLFILFSIIWLSWWNWRK